MKVLTYKIYQKERLICCWTLLPKFNKAIKQAYSSLSSSYPIREEVVSIDKAQFILNCYYRHIEQGNLARLRIESESNTEIPIPSNIKPKKVKLKLKRR